jgi:hypothetical protein
VLLFEFAAEVVQATNVLHLGYAYAGSTARVFVGTQLSNGICHIVQLMLILHLRPFHTAIGQVFIVVFTFIMDGVE